MDIKNSFLADTINTLTELGKKAAAPTFHDVNGRTFLVTGSDYTEVEPPEIPKPEKVSTRSLNALVALIKSEVDSQTEKPPLYVSCNTYSDVEVFTTPNPKDELHRWQPYHATASDLPPLVEDVRWSFDEAMIKLRSMFQRAPEGEKNDVDYILDLGEFNCTAYCSEQYEHICGTGDGITASGAPVQAGVTVAADPDILPLGSAVYIEGVGLRYVQDTGSAVKGKALDVAVDTHSEALTWSGYGTHRVWLLEVE